jgi:glycosyltransferase involved in cell wall biosynthesis
MRVLPKLTDRPEISIILCVKNGESSIREAIDSLFLQTETSWDLIVINDGSTDSTQKILEEFLRLDPERVQVFQQENIGLTKSLNRAIKMTKGKYIARMDADDICSPDRLAIQLSVIKRDSFDFVVSRAFKDQKNIPSNLVFWLISKQALKLDNFFVHGTFFGKREIFLKLLYDEKLRFAQDYDFILRLLKGNYKMGYIFKPLYYVGTGLNQISASKFHEQRDFAKKISLSHYKSRWLVYYWNLSPQSIVRKIIKGMILLSFFGQWRIKKIINHN